MNEDSRNSNLNKLNKNTVHGVRTDERVRIYQLLASLNNVGIQKIQRMDYVNGIRCFAVIIATLNEMENLKDDKHIGHCPSSNIQCTIMNLESLVLHISKDTTSTCSSSTFVGSVANEPIELSIQYFSRTIIDDITIHIEQNEISPIRFDTSDRFSGTTEEMNLLAVTALYNSGAAMLLFSNQLATVDHVQSNNYLRLSHQTFVNLLHFNEVWMSTISRGDVHFLYTLLVSILVFKCKILISQKYDDTTSATIYSLSLNAMCNIAYDWSDAAGTLWGTLFQRNLAGAA